MATILVCFRLAGILTWLLQATIVSRTDRQDVLGDEGWEKAVVGCWWQDMAHVIIVDANNGKGYPLKLSLL